MPSINGSVDGNSQNTTVAHTPRQRSTFPLYYHLYNTHRFGEYIPHYVEDAVKDDSFPIHSSSVVRSYTLKSPLMQNLKRRKDYFSVPMEAILPLNWQKFFEVPVRGDDVSDLVGTAVPDFWKRVSTFMSSCNTAFASILSSGTYTNEQILEATLRFLIVGEFFYSNGNLLSSLGCHGAPYVNVVDAFGYTKTWDDFFDSFLHFVMDLVFDENGNGDGYFYLSVDGYNYTVSQNDKQYGLGEISLRHALQLMRDNPTFTISQIVSQSVTAIFGQDVEGEFQDWTLTFDNAAVPCDLRRLWAYQLSCAHYFSNDHIDFIYTAELYRQLIGNYLRTFIVSYGVHLETVFFFTFNGVNYQYDYLSGKTFDYILGTFTTSARAESVLLNNSYLGTPTLGFLSALFGYRRSLRYLDYFTGSRITPLAVVNTNVAVSGGNVSVIDITKGIAAQRLGNAVNRVRHNFENYLQGIFGGRLPAPDYHNPFYLASTQDSIFGQETENTGYDQLTKDIAVTTNLRGSGKYMFNCSFDRPCVVIGITSYDIARVYTKSMERSFLKTNRFDDFNPFMQYNGDQQIYLQELGIKPTSSSLLALANFSYTTRHMEYKQRFNQAAGAFCVPSQNLDNWIFTARDRRGTQASLNPDWIRSVSAELDNFYNVLNGLSLGTYKHFIVDDYNTCKASRPMAYAPNILQ